MYALPGFSFFFLNVENIDVEKQRKMHIATYVSHKGNKNLPLGFIVNQENSDRIYEYLLLHYRVAIPSLMPSRWLLKWDWALAYPGKKRGGNAYSVSFSPECCQGSSLSYHGFYGKSYLRKKKKTYSGLSAVEALVMVNSWNLHFRDACIRRED